MRRRIPSDDSQMGRAVQLSAPLCYSSILPRCEQERKGKQIASLPRSRQTLEWFSPICPVKSITNDGHLLDRLTGLGNLPVDILRYNRISLIHRMAGLLKQQLSAAGRFPAGRLYFERQRNGPAHFVLCRLLWRWLRSDETDDCFLFAFKIGEKAGLKFCFDHVTDGHYPLLSETYAGQGRLDGQFLLG